VTESRAGRIVEALHAAAPKVWARVAPRAFGRLAYSPERAASGPGNLFEPIPKLNRETGGHEGRWLPD
jgi:hypothetical protein